MGRLCVLAMMCAVAFGSVGGVAHADPGAPAPPPPPCTFTLSASRESGTVTATVQSSGCAALAAPYSTVACLKPEGGAIRCEQARGNDSARVSLPDAPGVTIVATGRGCAGWAGLPPAPYCQLLGPDSVTP